MVLTPVLASEDVTGAEDTIAGETGTLWLAWNAITGVSGGVVAAARMDGLTIHRFCRRPASHERHYTTPLT